MEFIKLTRGQTVTFLSDDGTTAQGRICAGRNGHAGYIVELRYPAATIHTYVPYQSIISVDA